MAIIEREFIALTPSVDVEAFWEEKCQMDHE
jgi:hypothetical protein